MKRAPIRGTRAYQVLLHLVAAVGVGAFAVQLWQRPSSADLFRQEMVAHQRILDASARPGAIWFFGDSIIQQMDVGRVTEKALNLGIGGDTVVGVRDRLADHPALSTASAVVLAVGVNDLDRATAAVADAYAGMLNGLPAFLPIVVSAVLPVDERADVRLRGRNAKASQLNRRLGELCAARHGCHFVDAGDLMRDAEGYLRADLHSGDGVHLSRSGYDLLITRLKEGLPR